jgi:site-specific recombinase XerD
MPHTKSGEIRVIIELRGLSGVPTAHKISTMPDLRIAGEGARVNKIALHLAGYENYLTQKGDSPDYIRKVLNNVRKVVDHKGWIEPEQINDSDVLAYLAKLKEGGTKSKTRNHQRDAINGFCSWMVKKQILSHNPIELVPRAKVTDETGKMLPTDDQVQALIVTTKSDRRKKDRWLVYTIAATTGLRLNEIKRLKVSMFRGGDDPHFVLPAGVTKSRKVQLAYMPDSTARSVAQHIESEGKGLDDPVVVSVPKWESVERDRRKAGIPKEDDEGRAFSFHSLRHYFCNRLADQNVDSETRRILMRHGSLAMTEGVYTRHEGRRLSGKMLGMGVEGVDDDDDVPIDYKHTESPMNATELVGGGGSNPLTPTSTANDPRNRDDAGSLRLPDTHGVNHNSGPDGSGGGMDSVCAAPDGSSPSGPFPTFTADRIERIAAAAYAAGFRAGLSAAHGDQG